MGWTDIVALCALFATIFAITATVVHNVLSVTPNIDFRIITIPEMGLPRVEIRNTGVGPAVIKRVHYNFDGKWLTFRSAAEIRQELQCSRQCPSQYVAGHIGSGDYLPAGDDFVLFSLEDPDECERFSKVVRIVVDYRSVYYIPYSEHWGGGETYQAEFNQI